MRRDGTIRQEPRSREGHTHAGLPISFGTPGAIAPDDTANAGVASTLARSDHRHAFTSATAAALTKTGTASEGVAATHARSDHVHATSVLPYGILPNRFASTANDSTRATGVSTDMTITNTVDNTRAYQVHLEARGAASSGSVWFVELLEAAAMIAEIRCIDFDSALEPVSASGTCLYLPAASGSIALTVRVTIAGGGAGTFQMQAAASRPRRLWVEDIGPR